MRGAAAARAHPQGRPRPESTSPDSRLGDRAVEEGAEASVKAQDAMAADRLPHAVRWGRRRSATPEDPGARPPELPAVALCSPMPR